MFTKENVYATCLDAAKVSLVVGTALSFINQTQYILEFSFTNHALLRIFLNFLVPFLVASYARYSLIYKQKKKENELGLKSTDANVNIDNTAGSEEVDTEKRVLAE